MGAAIFLFHFGFVLFFTGIMLNYLIIMKLAGNKFFVPLMWTVNFISLFINEYGNRRFFYLISPSLSILDDLLEDNMIQWNQIYRFSILKVLSFGIDRHYTITKRKDGQFSIEDVKKLTYKYRQEKNQPLERFNLLTFLAYNFYVPTFVGGPIISFSAWVSQIYMPQITFNRTSILKYAFRVLVDFIALEVWMHTQFSKAITFKKENIELLNSFSLLEICFLSFGLLIMIW